MVAGIGVGSLDPMVDFERCPVCHGELERERVEAGSRNGRPLEAGDGRQVCPNGCHKTLAWNEAREALEGEG